MQGLAARRLNYGQPINWKDSLNTGTVFWLKSLPKESGVATVPNLVDPNTSGTFTAGAWGSGVVEGISPDFDGAASFCVSTFADYPPASVRSWAIWTYRRSAGLGNVGRLWDHGNEGIFNSTTTYRFSRAHSTTAGAWTIVSPALNVWSHLLITYDSSNVANDALMYVNGIPVTVTRAQAPVGTPTVTGGSSHFMGCRLGGVSIWDGLVDDFHIWDRILDPSEAYPLFQESSKRYSSLLNWLPSPKILLAGGSNSQRGAIQQQRHSGGWVGVQNV